MAMNASSGKHNSQYLRPPSVDGTPTVDGDLLSVLAAMADPIRLRIIALLRERERCICHLTEMLGRSQGTISHHMAILKRAGLVRERRDPDDARWTHYSLDETAAARTKAAIGELLDTSNLDRRPASCRNGTPGGSISTL